MKQPVTAVNVAQAVLTNNFKKKDFMGIAGNPIQFNQNEDNTGQQQYAIEQSEQKPDGTVGWTYIAVEQVP